MDPRFRGDDADFSLMEALASTLERLEAAGYVAEPELAVAIDLMTRLQRPLFLEGEAGVGKTEVANALARMRGAELIRLQCYEGLDVNTAVYEWNYQRQLLAIQLQAQVDAPLQEKERHIFEKEFLLERPLLQAISRPTPPVLLIDEIDRADEEFEAYLLEVLADFQISIPELGTVKAASRPHVVLTSNATREVSDALRRRCLYYYLDYPSFDKELRIVHKHLPDIGARLAGQVVGFVQSLRRLDLQRKPGVAETLDWAAALLSYDVQNLEQNFETVTRSLICLVKTKADRDALPEDVIRRVLSKSVA